MENNITDNMAKLIATKVPDNDQIANFVQATKEYQELIKMGLAKERGFSILTTEEIYTSSSKNCYCQSNL
jgi:hypothetical protein